MNILRTKPLSTFQHSHLKPCLNAFDLVFLGVGAIIGAGVFVLTGVAAATVSGPAIILAYLLAGIACAFSAFSYAELASSVGGAGSAYGYTYAGLGEIFAWLIGWSLIVEYSVAVSAVAIGWSAYFVNICQSIGINLPDFLIHDPSTHGIGNIPAIVIILLLTIILCFGVRQSARFNNAIVFIKFLAIGLFILVAVKHIQPQHWKPFLPFGWHGVLQGAGLIFFAYIGFDAVSTAAEETINPQRNLPIGIIGSLIICTVIYIIVSGILTGIAPYTSLDNASPVSNALLMLGHKITAGFIAAGAIAGLTTVMLVMFYGLTRVFYAMSRDGLLPPVFSHVNKTTHSPVRIILVSGVIIALISGFVPMSEVAELVNIGTLSAFTIVNLGVIVLRIRNPNLPRHFKTPFYPWSPIIGVLLCLLLIANLSHITLWRFLIWMIMGLVVYFVYSYRHSILNKH